MATPALPPPALRPPHPRSLPALRFYPKINNFAGAKGPLRGDRSGREGTSTRQFSQELIKARQRQLAEPDPGLGMGASSRGPAVLPRHTGDAPAGKRDPKAGGAAWSLAGGEAWGKKGLIEGRSRGCLHTGGLRSRAEWRLCAPQLQPLRTPGRRRPRSARPGRAPTPGLPGERAGAGPGSGGCVAAGATAKPPKGGGDGRVGGQPPTPGCILC